MQLTDARVEPHGERGDARRLMRAVRDDDVARAQDLAPERHVEAAARRPHALNAGAKAHVEIALRRIALLIRGDLVLARERIGALWERRAGQHVHEARRQEAKRRPALAPRVADALVRFDDHCLAAACF